MQKVRESSGITEGTSVQVRKKGGKTFMAQTRRNQEHLVIDTNLLSAHFDYDHPDHGRALELSNARIMLNPTVIH